MKSKSKKRIEITTAIVLVAFLAVSSIAVVLAPEASYAAKLPNLSSTICKSISGTWTIKTNTCTIPAGTISNVTSGFSIPARYSLVIDGTLNIASHSVTIANSGTITVENVYDGVINTLTTGFILNGTLTNSGIIIIKNSGADSVGIGIIFGYAMYGDTIVGYDLSTLTNALSGNITILNSGNRSVGIWNYGLLTNSGVVTINALTGAGAMGILNQGSFTNDASGTINNYDGPATPYTSVCYIGDSTCIYGIANNGGTMINYGTTNNHGAIGSNGYVMLTYGTIYNYGTIYRGSGQLINYGTVDNYGTIINSGPDYPHNRAICINFEGATGC